MLDATANAAVAFLILCLPIKGILILLIVCLLFPGTLINRSKKEYLGFWIIFLMWKFDLLLSPYVRKFLTLIFLIISLLFKSSKQINDFPKDGVFSIKILNSLNRFFIFL